VDEVEPDRGQVVAQAVVAADLQHAAGEVVDVGRVDIRRLHGAVGADTLRQPGGDRTAAGARFQAAPAMPGV